MKTLAWFLLLLPLLFAGTALAGESGNHYPSGVEGIDAASVPPPGFYIRNYSFFYTASKLADGNGKDLPVGFKANVWAEAPRFIYISKLKALGGNVGFDLMPYVIHTNIRVNAAGMHKKGTGMGDLYFSPMILSWHGKRYDAAAAVSFFAPTGKWDAGDASSAGKNYWTTMATGGGTAYLDKNRRWTASLLARYEVHKRRRDSDVKLGNDFHFEWGLASSVSKLVQLGVVGYNQFQTTRDTGAAITWDGRIKDRVAAVGPEISVKIPKAMFFVSLRGLAEFAARDRAQGTMIVLTLTKRF